MADLLDEVEHVFSSVQPELRREQDNVVVLSETVCETLQDEDRLGAGHFAAQPWHLERLRREPVWTQQKSFDRVIEPAVGQIERGGDPGSRRVDLVLGTNTASMSLVARRSS